nr:hypothetical protein [Saccharopolyspora sp. ASAGF58]
MLDNRRRGRFVRSVGNHGVRHDVRGAQFVTCRQERCLVSARDDDDGSGSPQFLGEGAAESLGSTGDENDRCPAGQLCASLHWAFN